MPLILSARNISENSAVSAKEEEESSSDETDKKSSPDPAQRERVGDRGEGTQVGRLCLLFPAY